MEKFKETFLLFPYYSLNHFNFQSVWPFQYTKAGYSVIYIPLTSERSYLVNIYGHNLLRHPVKDHNSYSEKQVVIDERILDLRRKRHISS